MYIVLPNIHSSIHTHTHTTYVRTSPSKEPVYISLFFNVVSIYFYFLSWFFSVLIQLIGISYSCIDQNLARARSFARLACIYSPCARVRHDQKSARHSRCIHSPLSISMSFHFSLPLRCCCCCYFVRVRLRKRLSILANKRKSSQSIYILFRVLSNKKKVTVRFLVCSVL